MELSSQTQDTLDALLSRTSQSLHVSTLHDTTETSLIKPSLVKLRKLSKADIQLWTMAKTSTRSKAPSKVIQTSIPVKPRKAIIASVSHKSTKLQGANGHCIKHQAVNYHLSDLEPSISQHAVQQLLRSQVAELPGHRNYDQE